MLTGRPRNSSIVCETDITVYHISQSAMEKALEAFNDPYDSLESKMWRAFGIPIATTLLRAHQFCASWSLEKIKEHVERSAVPMGSATLSMTIPEFVSDVVVIYGQVVNANNEEEVFTAPCLVPRNIIKLVHAKNSDTKARILVIAKEDAEEHGENDDGSATTLRKLIVNTVGLPVKSVDKLSTMTKQKRTTTVVSFGVLKKSKDNLTKMKSDDDGDMADPLAPPSSSSPEPPPPERKHHSKKHRKNDDDKNV